MKLIIALLATSAILSAQAEPIVNSIEGVTTTDTEQRTAKYLFMQYDETTQLNLLFDMCDKSNISMGLIAYAENEKHEKAYGCWRVSIDGTLYQIALDAGGGKYLDYQLWASKFTPKFE